MRRFTMLTATTFTATMLTALLFLVCALPAYAADARLETRLQPETVKAVNDIVLQAKVQGLPAEPLVQKALEGKTKGASPSQIQKAVEALLGRLVICREVLGDKAEEAELTAGATALYAGVSQEILSELRKRRPESSLAVQLVVLADLIERGVEGPEASKLVVALTQAGINDRGFLALRDHVDLDIKSGIAPHSSVRTRAQGVLGKPMFRLKPSGREPF